MQPIQVGTGDPSLSNIRPIYGHVSATATRCGKNLANVTIASGGTAPAITNNGDGTVTFNGTIGIVAAVRFVATNIHLTAGVTYALSGMPQSSDLPNGVWLGIYLLDSTSAISGTADRGEGSTYTPAENMTVRLGARFPDGTTLDNVTFKPMLRASDTSASFEAYNGNNYEVTFGQTVYGGTLDLAAGRLTETMAFRELTGAETYSGTTVISIARASVGGAKTGGAILSDRFKSGFGTADFGSVRLSSAGIIQFSNNDLRFADADAFQTWAAAQYAAGTPVQLCYELATPQTIQLDPQSITTLQGQNNIWVTTETNEP